MTAEGAALPELHMARTHARVDRLDVPCLGIWEGARAACRALQTQLYPGAVHHQPDLPWGLALQDHSTQSQGLLCVWDSSSPGAPAEVLLLEGCPTCCCWAPAASGAGADLIFAGEHCRQLAAECGAAPCM